MIGRLEKSRIIRDVGCNGINTKYEKSGGLTRESAYGQAKRLATQKKNRNARYRGKV